MMGHALRRCGLKIKVKWKRIGKKKMQFSGLLFFLSILEASVSAVPDAVGLGLSSTKKIYTVVFTLLRVSIIILNTVLLYLKLPI